MVSMLAQNVFFETYHRFVDLNLHGSENPFSQSIRNKNIWVIFMCHPHHLIVMLSVGF